MCDIAPTTPPTFYLHLSLLSDSPSSSWFCYCSIGHVNRRWKILLGEEFRWKGQRNCDNLRLGFNSGNWIEELCWSLCFSWLELSCLPCRFRYPVSSIELFFFGLGEWLCKFWPICGFIIPFVLRFCK